MKNRTSLIRTSFFLQTFIFVSLLIPFVAFSQTGLDWYQFHGPNRDRISVENDWRTNWAEKDPKVLWTKPIGIGFASISVAGNRVFTMGNADNKDTVWCFDSETGKQIWKYTYDCELFPTNHEGGPGGTPTVDTDFVYTVSKDGQLFCFDIKTGEVKWSKKMVEEFKVKIPQWRFALSPLLEGNLLILDFGPIIALDKKTGDLVWKTADFGAAYSSPIAFTFNEKRYVASLPAFGFVALDIKDGKEFAKFPWETQYGVNATTPIISGNKIFLSCGYNKGCSLLEMDPKGQIKELWHNNSMRNHMNTCVLWKDFVYGFDESMLKCLDSKTGKEMWKQNGLGKGSLMLADGKLIVLSEKGELVVAEANEKEFKPLCRKAVLTGKCWTVPVLSHGKIFSRNAAGDLVCLDVKK